MSQSETHNWPDLAIGLYERLTGQNAKISYTFEDLKIDIGQESGLADSGQVANYALAYSNKKFDPEHAD